MCQSTIILITTCLIGAVITPAHRLSPYELLHIYESYLPPFRKRLLSGIPDFVVGDREARCRGNPTRKR
jgi:hypothetical protein